MNAFVAAMAFASGLGLLKLTLLTSILEVAHYGQYVAIFGISILLGAVSSFGLIERTIKIYPRLVVDGRLGDMFDSAKLISRVLLLRFFSLFVLGTFAVSVADLSVGWSEVAFATGIGLCTAWLALLASIYRAYGSRSALSRFYLFRGGAVCMFALIGGSQAGWVGALAGDFLASLLACFYAAFTFRWLFGSLDNRSPESASARTNQSTTNRDTRLYVANMLTSATLLADKSFVMIAIGAHAAGVYGVAMLIPQISQILVNAASQYWGPREIKLAYTAQNDRSKEVILKIGIFLILVFLGLILALLLRHISYIDLLYVKFDITNIILILASFAAFGQAFSLVEFYLIARDREAFVLNASLLSAGLFVALFLFGIYAGFGVEYYIFSSGFTRLAQLFILIFYLRIS